MLRLRYGQESSPISPPKTERSRGSVPHLLLLVHWIMSSGTYVPPILNSGAMVGSVAMSVAESKLQPQMSLEEHRQNEKLDQQRWTILSISVASAAMVTALVAMWWEASLITYLAFSFPLVTSPFVIRRAHTLNKLPTFKRQVNEVRVLVNDLAMENKRLTLEKDMLQDQVQKLQSVEQAFEDLVSQSGQDVNRLRTLAREHGSIQRDMKKIQQTQKMQQLLEALIRSDTNKNFKMDDSEMDVLMIRLKSIDGIQFNEANMRDSLHTSDSKSISSLYKVASGELEEDGYIEMT